MTQPDTEFQIGEDLYGVSVSELRDRIEIMRTEIARIEAELDKKQSDLSAAQNFFKKST